MNRFVLAAILLMISPFLHAYAQDATILKDSVLIGSDYYVLEELKLDVKEADAMEIYKRIRGASGVMEGAISLSPDQRLGAKKDTLLALIADSTLREAAYGFEHYQVLYDKQGLLNVSVLIQSYGSAFESRQYYCFDLATGKEIGGELFIDRNRLLRVISKKLEQEADIKTRPEDLGKYGVVTGSSGAIEGIKFFAEDTGNYRSSGYPVYEVYFEIKEIAPYIAPAYRKRVLISTL